MYGGVLYAAEFSPNAHGQARPVGSDKLAHEGRLDLAQLLQQHGRVLRIAEHLSVVGIVLVFQILKGRVHLAFPKNALGDGCWSTGHLWEIRSNGHVFRPF